MVVYFQLNVKKGQFEITDVGSELDFDFNFLQFPSVKFSDMLKPGRVWQEEFFKMKKSRGCQGSFFVFSIFVCFFFFLAERKPGLTNFSNKLKARKANKE